MSSQPVLNLHAVNAASAKDDADLDLLAAILAPALSAEARFDVAAALMDGFGGLAGLAAADAAALRRAGLSTAAISELGRVRALAVAMARIEAGARPVLSSWTALTDYLRADMAHAPREQFCVLYLDRRNILMKEEWRAEGTVSHAPVYNAGPARVARLGRVPDIAETQAYVVTVIDCYLALSAGRGVTNAGQCGAAGAAP